MNELQSLSQIFQNKLFRIPDYQRGYAWLDQQLRDFWEDLINLQPDRYHYTGLLSMKELSRKEAKKLDQEDQWLLESGFKPYHIVDGQQRLTTFVILLNEIIEFVRSLPENTEKVMMKSFSAMRLFEIYDPSISAVRCHPAVLLPHTFSVMRMTIRALSI